MTKKGAVIYCRVSTKEQVVEGNSLASQEKICNEYASRKEYEVIKTFLEKGESAKTDERTELNNLIEFCKHKSNGVHVVVFYKIDRWARHHLDYGNLKLMLQKYGVIVQSATENLEDTPSGRFMENVLASQAQFDNEMRAERCAGGMKDAMREGRYVWMAPIGYNNVKVAGKATISINPILGPLMNQTFELIAANNHPIDEVRNIMTKEGLVNKKGKPLSKAYFYTMVTNEVYAGWIVKFKERHKGTFKPIVSDELFEQVQRVLKHKGKKHNQHITDNPAFPLRRFVVNSVGKKLTGSWSKGSRNRYPYYRFGGKGSNYNRDNFEKQFVEHMNKYAFNEQHYGRLCRYIKKHILKTDYDNIKEIEQLRKKIKVLQERQTLLIQKNLDSIISDTMLSHQLEQIDQELVKINARLMSISQDTTDLDEALTYLKTFLKNPGKIWRNSKLPTKLALQQFQFPKGLTFCEQSFGTPEICSLFKAKIVVLGEKSAKVDLGFKNWNTPNTQCSQNNTSTLYLKNKVGSEIDIQFWGEFKKDASYVYHILKEAEKLDTQAVSIQCLLPPHQRPDHGIHP